jgi:hypothetical protein
MVPINDINVYKEFWYTVILESRQDSAKQRRK